MKKMFSIITLALLLCSPFSTAAQADGEWLPFFMLALFDSEPSAAQEKEVDPDVAIINRFSERFIPLDDKWLILDKDKKYIFTAAQKNLIIEEYASYIPQIKMKAKTYAEDADLTMGLLENPLLFQIVIILIIMSLMLNVISTKNGIVRQVTIIIITISMFYLVMSISKGCFSNSTEIRALRENEVAYSTIAIEKIYQESTTHRSGEMKDDEK